MVWGRRLVSRAAESGWPEAVRAYSTPEAADWLRARFPADTVQRHTLTPALLERVVSAGEHEGVLVELRRRVWSEADLRLNPDSDSNSDSGLDSRSLEGPRFRSRPSLVLVVEGLEKPGNLGAMVRTAAAMGAAAVVTVGPSADPWLPQSLRNSTGAAFTLPVLHLKDAEAAGAWCAARRLATLAAVLPPPGGADAAVDPAAALRQLRSCGEAASGVAVVVGAESRGLSRWWWEHADQRVLIPMPGAVAAGIDSLNASVAAGILLAAVVGFRENTRRSA